MTDDAARLYLVTPPSLDPQIFAADLEQILSGVPIACVRVALAEAADEDVWTQTVNFLLPVCHQADVPLIVTDHYRLVEPLGLDGVHLAASRTPLRDVRSSLGPDRIIGAYARQSRHDAMIIAEAGADYVSLGPIGDPGPLGDDARAEDDLFQWWAEMIETPVVAEGGVQPTDVTRLNDFADFFVPDISIWQAPDPLVQFKTYAAALS